MTFAGYRGGRRDLPEGDEPCAFATAQKLRAAGVQVRALADGDRRPLPDGALSPWYGPGWAVWFQEDTPADAVGKRTVLAALAQACRALPPGEAMSLAGAAQACLLLAGARDAVRLCELALGAAPAEGVI